MFGPYSFKSVQSLLNQIVIKAVLLYCFYAKLVLVVNSSYIFEILVPLMKSV